MLHGLLQDKLHELTDYIYW